jgi:hypothetical protein
MEYFEPVRIVKDIEKTGKLEWFCGIINLRRITIVAKSMLFSVLYNELHPPPPILPVTHAMIATSNLFFS